MNFFSTVDFSPYQGIDKSPSNEIASAQGLQDFSSNNEIALHAGLEVAQ